MFCFTAGRCFPPRSFPGRSVAFSQARLVYQRLNYIPASQTAGNTTRCRTRRPVYMSKRRSLALTGGRQVPTAKVNVTVSDKTKVAQLAACRVQKAGQPTHTPDLSSRHAIPSEMPIPATCCNAPAQLVRLRGNRRGNSRLEKSGSRQSAPWKASQLAITSAGGSQTFSIFSTALDSVLDKHRMHMYRIPI